MYGQFLNNFQTNLPKQVFNENNPAITGLKGHCY
jgi:hypothetical protein